MRDTLKKDKTPVFNSRVPGKWILAGEHSVLRGCEALVFPLFSKYLDLSYYVTSSELELEINGENKQELELIIWSVLENAFKTLNLRRSQITGLIKLRSAIALGGGMGASATLCVALTEWIQFLGYIKKDEMFDFARSLENLFHGESSGVDVAVTLNKRPLIFTRNHGFTELKITNMPLLYLSYSGERGVTKDCIDKVKKIIETKPDMAKTIDLQMNDSVQLFKNLFINQLPISDWAQAFEKAEECFEKWELVPENVRKHHKILKDSGAVAVKLTGSGGGGYVISLWNHQPPQDLPFELIACFE